jgi:hypothetical protein
VNSVIAELVKGLRRNFAAVWRENKHEFRSKKEWPGSPSLEQRRAYRCADWTARTVTPIALEAYGLHEHAAGMRALHEIVDRTTASAALDHLRRTKRDILRKIRSPALRLVQSNPDPSAALPLVSFAQAHMCATDSIQLAREADDRSNGREDLLKDTRGAKGHVTPAQCLAGAAAYALRATIVATEMAPTKAPDPLGLLRDLLAMKDALPCEGPGTTSRPTPLMDEPPTSTARALPGGRGFLRLIPNGSE